MYIEKRNDVVKTFTFDSEKDDLVIFLVCGRDIKYNKKAAPGKHTEEDFKDLKFQLERDAEICEILSTCEPDCY